jgi:hypothetical protein
MSGRTMKSTLCPWGAVTISMALLSACGGEPRGTGSGGEATTSTASTTSTSSGSCHAAPTLYPDPPTSEYCLHAASGETLYCTVPSEVCCLGAGDTSICAAAGSTCPSPLVTLDCTNSTQCGVNQVCCGAGAAPELDEACGYFAEAAMTSSSCVTGSACPSGLFQLCGSTAECATCTAFLHSSHDDLGFCN